MCLFGGMVSTGGREPIRGSDATRRGDDFDHGRRHDLVCSSVRRAHSFYAPHVNWNT